MEELQHSLSLQDEELTTQTELEPETKEQEAGPDLENELPPSTGQDGDQDTGQEEHHPDPDPTISPIRLGIVGTVYKGEFDETVDYLDRWQTTYDGSTYIAMKDHPKKPPFPDGDNWLISAKGYPESRYVRCIKGEASPDWYEGEVILTRADFGIDHVENYSLEEILENCVTGISVNHDPVRRGELNIDIVNTLSINHGEPMVGEVNIDVYTDLKLNGKDLTLENGSTDIRALESLLINDHIEVPNEDGVGHLSLIEGLIINDTEIAQKDYKQNLTLSFNGEPIEVISEDEHSGIDLTLSLNNKPVENHNLNVVETITINKKGPQVMLDGNVDLSIIEGVRINNQALKRMNNDVYFRLLQNGKELKVSEAEDGTVVDFTALRDITLNGEPVLVEDGVANLVIKPSYVALCGICENTGEETDKTVTIEEEYSLVKGERISVSFIHTNKATNCTLNINETGAYPILIKGRPISEGMVRSIQAGGTYTFAFDGENYIYLSGSTPVHDGREMTIAIEDWQENGEEELIYLATVAVDGLEADDYISLALSDNTDLALVKDYKKSGVWAYRQEDGSITLACEVKPELDWPMHLEITQ